MHYQNSRAKEKTSPADVLDYTPMQRKAQTTNFGTFSNTGFE